jgi:hypothetical protein
MVCAEDKFAYVCRKLAKWATATHLRIKDVEKMVSLLRWLSAGFPVGRSHLASLIHDLKKFKRIASLETEGLESIFLSRSDMGSSVPALGPVPRGLGLLAQDPGTRPSLPPLG